MATSCVAVVCLYVLQFVHVSGQTPSLTGATSGVLGSSVHLICTLPGSSASAVGLIFTRAGAAGTQCTVNIADCSQFSAVNVSSYYCGCVTGQTREFFLNISSLKIQDDDTWRCSYNGVTSNNNSIDVYYAPEISSTFPNNKDMTENSSSHIDCSSGLTAGNPSDTSYTWTGPGGYSKSGSVLDRSVSRSQGGSYTCTVRNSAGLSDSAQVNINVQYTPVISSSFPNNKDVTENSSISIDCSSGLTAGNPSDTSYTWTGPGNYSNSGSELDRRVSRSQGGSYTCTARNSAGLSDSAQVNINVQYIDAPVLNISQSEVMENASVHLECQVSSNPTVEMTISNLDNNNDMVDGEMTNTRQLDIDRVQCLHNGTFQCVVNNRALSRSESVTKELSVLCLPRYDVRKIPLTTIAAALNKPVQLVAEVIANPSPNFTWGRLDGDDLVPIRKSLVTTVHSSKLKSVLQFKVTSSKDYGQYAVKVQNMVGETLLKYQLTAKAAPFLPTNFKETVVGPKFVGIEWTSNFNGGAQQTFYLEYHSDGRWMNISADGIRDPGWDKVVMYNVTKDVKTASMYFFQLYTSNIYGTSQKLTLNVTTLEDTTLDRSSYVGMVAGVVTAICLLAALVIVLFLLYRRGVFNESKCFKREKRKPSNTDQVIDIQATNAYSDLDHKNSDRQTYNELTTYQNHEVIAETALTTASPYSDLDLTNPDRQTYTALKTFKDHQASADYEDTCSSPGTESTTY